MKKNVKIIFLPILLLLVLVLGFVIFSGKQTNENFKADFINGNEGKLIDKLTLDQKIGQLFIIGFEGKVFNEEIEGLIKELHPGGVLLLGRNVQDPSQLKKLINDLQEASLKDSGLPLFVAVDQEGGLVSRIDWVENMPQSEIKNAEQAHQIGKKRGGELKETEVNLNFAPLADTAFPGDFIFERSFKKDQKTIGEFSKELILGQKESGIFSCLKHFPGYGGIYFNPEDRLATLDKMLENLQFKKAAEGLPEMIMVSNVIYKDFSEKLPFSFLPSGVSLLKKEIPGNYLLISDDLSQYSLLNNFPMGEIVSSPFNAGIDILIFSGWRMPASEGIKSFKKAVEQEKISSGRINQSVSKIIELKQKLLKDDLREN